ncbi:hypothetical protein EDC01DRAFT_719698 [Geopyxis carbonaria]|nr:hypothetical protein EDC01DRAFT_719698 [Geopyxis carbonaria]
MSENTIELPAADAVPPVTFFKRTARSKTSLRKRAPTPPPAAASSDDDSDYSSSDERAAPGTGAARPLKKRKTGVTLTASSSSAASKDKEGLAAATVYGAASRTMVSDTAAEATKKVDWYDEDALLGRSKKQPPPTAGTEPPEVGGTYKGAAATYGSFIKKSEKAAARMQGPLKASSNVRTITITDYAPDVCKDYKQTGFCGFGDTCKFLHAREDYAAGWKLDREWEIGANGKRKPQAEEEDDEAKELRDIPFKCVICKEDYKAPIVTKCGHYFCESCAIKRYKKNPGCAICGKRTDGVFNVAKTLRRKLDRKQVREDEKKAKEEAEAAEAEGK